MFKLIEGLPADVLAIEASGKVTHQDYRETFIPQAEAMMARGPVRMLYAIDADVSGFELDALWDDAAFGLRHWDDFSAVAVVADQTWIRTSVALFAPLIPAQVKLFGLADLAEAKDWIAQAR